MRAFVALLVCTLVSGTLVGCGKKEDEETISVRGGPTNAGGTKIDVADAMADTVGRAEEKAEQVTCLSNLKQLAVANLMYVSDWEGWYPHDPEKWSDAAYPYYKSEDILLCPSDDALPSYALSGQIAGMAQSDIGDPAGSVLLFEADDGKTVAYRHDGGVNIALADGHAKWYTPEQATPLHWAPSKDDKPVAMVPAKKPPTPRPSTAKPEEQTALCMSNVKCISMAMLMYAQDYDEKLPPASEKTFPLLSPYTKNDAVFFCPADAEPPSYAMNAELHLAGIARVARPSETVSLFETDDGETVADRHNGGAVYAFCDGHVKWAKDGREKLLWKLD